MKFFLLLPAAAFVLSGAVLGGCARAGTASDRFHRVRRDPRPSARELRPRATCRRPLRAFPTPKRRMDSSFGSTASRRPRISRDLAISSPRRKSLRASIVSSGARSIATVRIAAVRLRAARIGDRAVGDGRQARQPPVRRRQRNRCARYGDAGLGANANRRGQSGQRCLSRSGAGQSVGPPTPVYWEAGFEKPYRAFIKAVVAKYGGDPRIGYMRFGVGPGAEDFVAHGADGACFSKWKAYGLSARSWPRTASHK